MVNLCTSSKVNKSLQNLSRLLDKKSICGKYGLTLDDPLVKQRKAKKRAKREFKETFYKNRRNYPKNKKRFLKLRQGQASRIKRGYYKYIPRTHYYNPSDIHLHTNKQEKWNKITCWLCGKIGHTSSQCLEGEESKLNKGKKSQIFSQRNKQVKQEGRRPIVCTKCGSHDHSTERYPNVTIKDIAQQHQIEESSYDYFSSSSAEELHAYMENYSDSGSSECSCSDSKECACQIQYNSDYEYFSESSYEEGEKHKPQKEKVLMVATEEKELKILSQIHAMEDGEMKNRLT